MQQSSTSSISLKWRVVDIVVASLIGVVSALIYWVAAAASSVPWGALEAIVPGLAGLCNGVWLFAAPLAAVIVRKPGAALYAEIVAGVIEALIGNMWGGLDTFLIAFVQGLAAEIVFLLVAYRVFNLLTVTLSGAVSGVGCWFYSFITHLQGMTIDGPYGVVYLITSVISGALIAGVLMWWLYLAIAKTGALNKFASGRQANA